MTHWCLPLYSYLKSLRKKYQTNQIRWIQVKSTHYYKGQLVLDIEYDAYWASCWFDTSAGIREHTGINLSEVYEDTEPEYFNK